MLNHIYHCSTQKSRLKRGGQKKSFSTKQNPIAKQLQKKFHSFFWGAEWFGHPTDIFNQSNAHSALVNGAAYTIKTFRQEKVISRPPSRLDSGNNRKPFLTLNLLFDESNRPRLFSLVVSTVFNRDLQCVSGRDRCTGLHRTNDSRKISPIKVVFSSFFPFVQQLQWE